MASRFSPKAVFEEYRQNKSLPPPPSSPSPTHSDDSITQSALNQSSSRMAFKSPRAKTSAAPPASPTPSSAFTASDIPDIRDIERKQQAVQRLLDQGKVKEGSVLAKEVARDLQVYQQWCLAEKVRRLKVGIAIQEEAIKLFRGRGFSQETLAHLDELFDRAVDREMRVDREAHDLLLPGPQTERLTKKMRVTAQVLEAVYQDCIKGGGAAQVQQYARYYHAFCFPACLNHKVFSPAEFKQLGLRFHQEEVEGEGDKEE
ncbi:hypothetical protein TWF730_008081 [Orbilia blumenaviensis]|uniref:Uncharacterized protein n=1 Tax=Orbilia blumenaviensis TaxID=1796055 RepID=A0AAV9VDH4_9PEZI